MASTKMFLLGFQEMILPNILTTNYWHLWSNFKGRMLRNGQKMRRISWLTWTRKRGWGRGCDIVKSNMHFLNHIYSISKIYDERTAEQEVD